MTVAMQLAAPSGAPCSVIGFPCHALELRLSTTGLSKPGTGDRSPRRGRSNPASRGHFFYRNKKQGVNDGQDNERVTGESYRVPDGQRKTQLAGSRAAERSCVFRCSETRGMADSDAGALRSRLRYAAM